MWNSLWWEFVRLACSGGTQGKHRALYVKYIECLIDVPQFVTYYFCFYVLELIVYHIIYRCSQWVRVLYQRRSVPKGMTLIDIPGFHDSQRKWKDEDDRHGGMKGRLFNLTFNNVAFFQHVIGPDPFLSYIGQSDSGTYLFDASCRYHQTWIAAPRNWRCVNEFPIS